MNWNRFGLRLLVSLFVLGIMTLSHVYQLVRHFIGFMRYGGELVTMSEKDPSVTLQRIYESVKAQENAEFVPRVDARAERLHRKIEEIKAGLMVSSTGMHITEVEYAMIVAAASRNIPKWGVDKYADYMTTVWQCKVIPE